MHRFSWLDDALIGAVDHEWNFLVEWHEPYEGGRKPKAVHYTGGGPWFPDFRDCDYAEDWMATMRAYEASSARARALGPYERFSQSGFRRWVRHSDDAVVLGGRTVKRCDERRE